MKWIVIFYSWLISGCASNDYIAYVEAQRATSKDNTMAELACYNVITEGVKSNDLQSKSSAIAFISQCKKKNTIIQPPKKNWVGM